MGYTSFAIAGSGISSVSGMCLVSGVPHCLFSLDPKDSINSRREYTRSMGAREVDVTDINAFKD